MQSSMPKQLHKISAQRMDDHIDEARAYLRGLENIKKDLRDGGSLETSETRYADKVSDFQEKLELLLSKSNIKTKAQDNMISEQTAKMVEALSSIFT